jgi:DNA modification methylase
MTSPKIVMPSQIVMRATASLIGYARNSRTHDERQIDVLCTSITEYGFTNPILIDGDRGVIAGHGRIMAAERLGLVEVPCIELRHLTNEQKRAYLILDNQSALMSTWSEALLAQELADLSGVGIEATDLGFDAAEVDRLMETLGVDFGGKADGDPDAVPEAPVVPTSKLGDVWLLGKHRLMCGDSTDRAQVERLMDGEKADMVFTDPPYGVSFVGTKGTMYSNGKKLGHNSAEQIRNDDLRDEDLSRLFADSLGNAVHASSDEAALYVFFAINRSAETLSGLAGIGISVRNWLVWDKGNVGFHAMGAQYKPNYEAFLYCHKTGHSPSWHGDTHQQTVWRHSCERLGLHPTMKPVALICQALTNHEPTLVLDVFGGSGSTLMACEKAGREARLMELDPAYVDVIVRRWQDFTGQAATLDGDGRTFAEIAEARRA